MNLKNYSNLTFTAQPSKLFVIMLVNFFFTIITLGLYYPWAKAKMLQYMYSETEFHGSRFIFHGTGKEMFRAYIKVFILFLVLFGSVKVFTWMGEPKMVLIATGVLYLVVLALIPLAIHGVLRYRLSRTSWRGIHMGYRGSLSKLYKIYLLGILFSILTIGFYIPWLLVNMRKYVLSNIRFGTLEFKFSGRGLPLLGKYWLGMFLTIITFYIYMPWFLISLKNFKIRNTSVVQNGVEYPVKSTMDGGSYFALILGDFLILIFTLGLGMVFVLIRDMTFELSNMHFSNEIDMNAITQTEADYKDATGEDLSDALDLNIF
ncbi:YjgN family protein [Cytophaga aurantiaca]|uniref:YjgN family protein n=1 Tax=Cytophaga aurantiaca TaxID=29530 RepID=UPI000372B959|nr:DUF898 family protein [Cytophaga aurantiaca]